MLREVGAWWVVHKRINTCFFLALYHSSPQPLNGQPNTLATSQLQGKYLHYWTMRGNWASNVGFSINRTSQQRSPWSKLTEPLLWTSLTQFPPPPPPTPTPPRQCSGQSHIAMSLHHITLLKLSQQMRAMTTTQPSFDYPYFQCYCTGIERLLHTCIYVTTRSCASMCSPT